jgi:hypothetical protein
MSGPRVTLLSALSLTLLLAGGRPCAAADQKKVEWKKPVLYSLSLMGVGLTLLVATGEAADDPRVSNFRDAFREGPKQDDDSGVYNFVLHPLWGSETYLRAREAHMGKMGSIAFSLAASITWEYFFESWTEHPSTQDLIFTTGLGWMLGELRYRVKQRTGKKTHWWIDPINTTLEHVGIGVARNGEEVVPMLTLSFRF